MTGEQARPPRRGFLRGMCRIIGGVCMSSVLHTITHLIWLGIKCLVVLLFILWAIGIPGGLVSNKFQSAVDPYQIDMQRITWNPLRGLIIHKLRIVEPALSPDPLLTADSCVIRPDYPLLLQKTWKTRQIGFTNGRLAFPVASSNQPATTAAVSIDIHSIEGSVDFSGEDTRLAISGITDIGTKCLISGEILPRRTTSTQIDAHSWIDQVRAIHTSTYHAPPWLFTLREQIKTIQFKELPQATLIFGIDQENPERSHGKMAFRSSAFTFGHEAFDGFVIEAGFTGPNIIIEQARMVQGDRQFLLTGKYNFLADVFEAFARNDLPMNTVDSFFPAAWREKMNDMGMTFSGNLLAEGWIGPCKLSEAPFSWGGWTSIENASINELYIRKAFTSFKRKGHLLTFEDGILDGGTGIGKGTLSFSVQTDFDSRVTRGTLDIGIELKQLKPIMTRGLRQVADMFDIREKPVLFNGTFSVPHSDVNQTVVTGTILATNAVFRNVDITGLNTYLTYTNRSVILDPLLATCSTGSITGSLDLNIPDGIYGIDLEITTNPKTVAPMAGKTFARYFNPYFFTDNILVRARGVVNAKTDENTDLNVYISGQQIGITNLICDRLLLQGRRTPGFLMISNMNATIFQGTITGSLAIALGREGTTYDLDAGAADVSMDKLIKNFSPGATNLYEGAMTARVKLAGPFPDEPHWTNLHGTGTFLIQEGRLLRIPLLGGLSSLLSKIYPGLGFSEQNLLTADVTFHDGAVFSENLKLSGGMISLAADGKYELRDNLDFKVRVHPFRDGSIASALRIVTMPISMLLEFNVTGPVKNPSWKAANFPL